MLIELVDKLIDRCIQLVEKREQLDRSLYADFLAPALEEFEKVHKDYVTTFMSYKEILQSSSATMDGNHPIFDRIAKDSVLSGGIRAKIVALNPFMTDPLLGRFVHRMCACILGGSEIPKSLAEGLPFSSNAPRRWYHTGLRNIFAEEITDEEKKARAIKLAEYLVSDQQSNYQLVMYEHVRLKARLLGLKVPDEPFSRSDAYQLSYENRHLFGKTE